jgi:hypothetical protein
MCRKLNETTTISFFLLLVVLAVAGVYAFSSYKDQLNQDAWSNPKQENSFAEPEQIQWIGEVVTQMESKKAYAMKMIAGNSEYEMFYTQPFVVVSGLEDKLMPQFEVGDYLNIRGNFLGITCAYQNSVFGGDCVPDVVVESVIEVDQSFSLSEKTSIVDYDTVWDNQKINIETHSEWVDVSYPSFSGKEYDNLNNRLKDFVEKRIEESRDRQKDIFKKEPKCQEYMKTGPSECSVSLSGNYFVSTYNEIISVVYIVTDYTGGGNGNHDQLYVMNYDRTSGQLIGNKDVFCKDNYINEIKEITKVRFIELRDKEKLYSFHDLENGEFMKLDDEIFENISFYPNGIDVQFQPYSVASGADGIVDVFIPYDKLGIEVCY